ncbi:hypothetical protein LMH87_001343 [Akanthomyces muscarius]|uniref:Cytochrome P450 monooxygenase n=1 Tax=Akanthomyces muscarius TaxID=2231603 RepID=A0A9W8QGV8_AKAMU|nr:hypothetical protein LMH87_001343 [Akanthomyces muscarius]KAJ4156130.1 hypothetical protein LMH87_001343 [Akanthomyces muscarius]
MSILVGFSVLHFLQKDLDAFVVQDVDGVDAMRIIYQGGFAKSPWYSVFDNYGVPCMFSTLESKAHSKRKRMISNVYSKSLVMSSEAAKAQSHVIMFNRLLPLLKDEAAKSQGGTEVQSLFMATTMDLISALIGMSGWTFTYRATIITSGPRSCPSSQGCSNELECASILHLSTMPMTNCAPGTNIVVFNAMQQGIRKEEKVEGHRSILYETTIQQRDASIASEILDQVLAGHETAGIVLTYASWHLSKSPGLQAQLREELLPLIPCGEDILPDARKLDGLPLLNAIVMETLRLHAPIPGPQPRQTPYPGSHIEGHFIPGGVRIASLAHTLHLNEAVFSKAAIWNPNRWLESSDQDTMKRHFWAFGSGGRMCIGSNFALQEMKTVISIIYVNFTTTIMDDSGIEQTDGYSARPKADRLFLRFRRVSDTI